MLSFDGGGLVGAAAGSRVESQSRLNHPPAVQWSRPPAQRKSDAIGCGKEKAYIFVVEDVFSLGHMQMSFIQLFVWLHTIQTETETMFAVFETKEDPEDLAWTNNIKDTYYIPMLGDFQNYTEETLGRKLILTEMVQPKSCLPPFTRTKSIKKFRRSCMPTGDSKKRWLGHCVAWFPTSESVKSWRRFLSKNVLLAEHATYRRGENKPLQTVIFDRATGYIRSLLDPISVMETVRDACENCNVSYYQFEGGRSAAQTWKWNCRFFASYDFVIMVHGAAVSNIVCLDGGLIEMGPAGNTISMYQPLAEQLDLDRIFVPWSSGNMSEVVQPDLTTLHEAVQHISKALWSKRAAATS